MKKLILPILILFICTSVWAQRPTPERIKAQKVAFITNQLDLSAKESQEFWPIYNAFEEKVNNIRKNDLREVRQAMRSGNLSSTEAQVLLDKFMAVEDKLHEAKKKLVNDLGNIIPPQKIIQLKSSEEAFNKKLLELLKNRREQIRNRRN